MHDTEETRTLIAATVVTNTFIIYQWLNLAFVLGEKDQSTQTRMTFTIAFILLAHKKINSALTLQQNHLQQNEDQKQVEDDYYALLGVARNATTAEIRKRYYQLIKLCHPDKIKSEALRERFEKLTQAYHVLSNSKERRKYDEQFKRRENPPLFISNIDYLQIREVLLVFTAIQRSIMREYQRIRSHLHMMSMIINLATYSARTWQSQVLNWATAANEREPIIPRETIIPLADELSPAIPAFMQPVSPTDPVFTINTTVSETQAAIDRSSNPESTMNSFVSASCVMALKRVELAHWGHEATAQDIEQLFRPCIEKLKLNPDLQEIVNHICERIDEPTGTFDNVMIYSPNEGEQCITFDLKKSLVLAYIHSQQSAADVADRELTLARCLQNIYKSDKAKQALGRGYLCHQGLRNELAFTVSTESHRIIEDERSFASSYIKEQLEIKLASEISGLIKIEKAQALLKWLDSGDASELIKVLDPANEIKTNFINTWITHGVAPKHSQQLIATAENHLQPSDSQPLWVLLHAVMNAIPSNKSYSSDRDAALQCVQNWIAAHPVEIFENKQIQIKLNDFYNVLTGFDDHYRYQAILKLESKVDLSNLLLLTCKNYFNRVQSWSEPVDLDRDSRQLVKQYNNGITEVKKNKLATIFGNFFAAFFLSADLNEKKSLYQFFISKKVHEIILLSTEEVSDIANALQQQTQYTLTVELINRIFLQAIITNPLQWDEKFAYVFDAVLKFVNNHFNEQGNGLFASISSTSYPTQLIQQLQYHKYSYLADRDCQERYPIRPSNMLLLPEHVLYFSEWKQVSSYMTKEQLAEHYQILRLKIDPLLIAAWNENPGWHRTSVQILRMIPSEKIEKLLLHPTLKMSSLLYLESTISIARNLGEHDIAIALGDVLNHFRSIERRVVPSLFFRHPNLLYGMQLAEESVNNQRQFNLN